MQYWWVNQNQTYKHEVGGQYMWSPKTKKDGSRNPFYDFMTKVAPGDVVFSFFDTRIAALGKVISPAETAPKPDFGAAGGNWGHEGWLVPTEFFELSNQVRPKDHIATLREYLPSLYSPLNSESQSVYLTAVPESLAEQLGKLIGPEFTNVLGELTVDLDVGAQDEDAEKASAAEQIFRRNTKLSS